ncbi:MAG: hypothetical protein ACI39W_08245 [Brotaphodocola sp.]
MNFFRSKLGIFSLFLVVMIAAAVAWYCLSQKTKTEQPDGTLVWNKYCMEVKV